MFERETKVDIPAALQPPGGSLACALDGLDLSKATPGGLVDVAAGAQALMRWAEALQRTAIARLADHYTMTDEASGPKDPKRPAGKHFGADDGSLVSEFLAHEVAAALSISKTAAGNKLGMALDLDQRLSDTRQAMRDGKLDGWKARLIAERTRALDAQRARVVERQVLDEAPALVYGKLRSRLDRLACAAAPDEAAADAKAAFAQRRMYRGEEPNGMAGLHVRMGADQAATVWNACDAKALASRQFAGPHDRRTLEQRRVDALVALCGDSLDRSLAGRFTPDQPPASPAEDEAGDSGSADSESSDAGAARGFITPFDRTPTQAALARLASIIRRRCTINLTVGADILLSQSNSPGYLHGHGWTSAPAARRLLGETDPVMRRLILDPIDGTPLDLSRKTYRPTPEVAEMARLLSTTCTFPGCGRDSSRCQLDHTDPHPKGRNGPGRPGDVHETSPTRLGAMCDTDHRLKTHGGWAITRLDNHRWEWVSPLGKVYYTFNETLSPRTLAELATAEAAEKDAREHPPPEPAPVDPDDSPPF